MASYRESNPSPYLLAQPQIRKAAFVYNAPHSGLYYPEDLLRATNLSETALRTSEDSFVDRLYAGAPALGAPLLAVHYARAYVDTNRERLELDPKLLTGPMPLNANTTSERVQAGLGTIPAIVASNQRIYAQSLSVSDALDRIQRVWDPVHDTLRGLLAQTKRQFGYAVLIDCHSMPSGPLGWPEFLGRGRRRNNVDMVLGDRHGASCAPILVETAEQVLRGLGYRVLRNVPYAGGFNTEHYGRPDLGQHALQIEINRGLYMDEARFEPKPNFDRLCQDLQSLMQTLHSLPAEQFHPLAAIHGADGPPLQQSAE